MNFYDEPMPDAGYLAATVSIAATITFALRAVPFLLVEWLRASASIRRLGQRMPAGLMVILLVYLLHASGADTAGSLVPQAAGILVTIGLHLKRGNALLSVFAGTATFVVLVNAVPGLNP